MYRKQMLIVILGMVIYLNPTSLLAAESDAKTSGQTGTVSKGDNWEFEFTPYLFGASLKGNTGISTPYGDVTADVDMSFDDILKNLDSGFMALFTASKGKWTFGAEGVYFKLKDQQTSSWQGPLGNTSTGSLTATMTEQIYQITAAYRVVDHRTKVDMLGAGRYTQLDSQLNLAVTTGPDLLPDGSRSVGATQSWWDPVIGVRVLQPLSDDWTFVGYADIGGFGIGSDLTYQLIAGVNWQFAKSVSAKAGLRYLYQDYEQNGFIWDMAASGLYLGVGFRF